MADALLDLLIRITLGVLVIYMAEGLYRTLREFFFGGRR